MNSKFYCWFPTLGQISTQATCVLASSANEAAEAAARKRCWDDTEWEDHLVAVSTFFEGDPVMFEVQVESRPHFTATKVSG